MSSSDLRQPYVLLLNFNRAKLTVIFRKKERSHEGNQQSKHREISLKMVAVTLGDNR